MLSISLKNTLTLKETGSDAIQQIDKGSVGAMNRDPINLDNDDLHHEVLETCHGKNDKGKGSQKDAPNFITGAIVTVPWEDRKLWTYDMIVKPNINDQRGNCYII